MDEDNNMINDSKTIAKIFNDHFSFLGSRVQQNIPVTQGNFKSYLYKQSSNGRLLINPDGCTFFLSPVTPDEICKIIDGLDSK